MYSRDGLHLFLGAEQLDTVDLSATLAFLLAIIVLPVIGYWLAVVDFRAYLRSLKGMLVKVAHRFHDSEGEASIPDWVLRETPPCISALGLSWPCTELQVKEAYRKLAEINHPDLGGNRQKFLNLQTHFEQAIRLVRNEL